MARPIRHARQFLRRNDAIAALLSGIESDAKLLRAARAALPPPLDSHCLHATLDEGTLTLYTDSPVWASRLRFFAPELKRILAAGHRHLETCRVRVQPPTSAPPRDSRAQPERLSKETVSHLMAAAANAEDSDIAAALRRLAKAGRD